jgi:hypothetical protein
MKLTPEFFESELARIKTISPYCIEGAPEDYLRDALAQIAQSLREIQKSGQQGDRYRLPATFHFETQQIPEIGILGPLDANENDPTRLWAEIWKLRAEARGPDKYETWRDAAIEEKMKRLAAERCLEAFRDQIRGLLT